MRARCSTCPPPRRESPWARPAHCCTSRTAFCAAFPQVQSVFGKAGRVESATDPAPLSMMETVVVLKPREQWPERERWYTHRTAEVDAFAAGAHLAGPPEHQRSYLRHGRIERSPHHAGRDQCLDDADQGAHRHADHRRAHPARHQGAGLQSGRDRAHRPRGGAGLARRSAEPPASTPSAPPEDISSTSPSSATRWRATASPSTMPSPC